MNGDGYHQPVIRVAALAKHIKPPAITIFQFSRQTTAFCSHSNTSSRKVAACFGLIECTMLIERCQVVTGIFKCELPTTARLPGNRLSELNRKFKGQRLRSIRLTFNNRRQPRFYSYCTVLFFQRCHESTQHDRAHNEEKDDSNKERRHLWVQSRHPIIIRHQRSQIFNKEGHPNSTIALKVSSCLSMN